MIKSVNPLWCSREITVRAVFQQHTTDDAVNRKSTDPPTTIYRVIAIPIPRMACQPIEEESIVKRERLHLSIVNSFGSSAESLSECEGGWCRYERIPPES